MLKEIKALAEGQTSAPAAPDTRAKTSEASMSQKSRFGAANETALRNIQQELVTKRMEALAERLGLSPEESHIDVRRTAGGRCFGLLRFIVNIGYGVREATAVEYRRTENNPDKVQELDRGYFGNSANTAADILASMDSLKPTEVLAWTNGRLAFLDVVMEGIGASVRVCTKPAPGPEPADKGPEKKEGE
jgi:hypothetical protein